MRLVGLVELIDLIVLMRMIESVESTVFVVVVWFVVSCLNHMAVYLMKLEVEMNTK